MVPAQREQHEQYKAARERMEAAGRNPRPALRNPIKIIDLKEEREQALILARNQALERALDNAIRDAVSSSLPPARAEPWPAAIRRIKRECCEGTPYSPADVDGRCRCAPLVRIRQMAMWRVYTEIRPRLSLPRIGRRFGGRNHTTVLHAVRKVEARIARGEAPCP
jgi:chromosomal replication initiation ATPase DnaA